MRPRAMHKTTHLLSNDSEQPLTVWFEPWADELTIAPHSQFRLEARSEQHGDLEIDYLPHRIVVYGWAGSTLQIFNGSELVRDFDVPFPDLPLGMSVKAFIQLLFGDQPPPAEGKADLN